MTTQLQTPAEFAESEFESLKEFLGTYDIQINKVGLIGYLVNLLGNIKYDSQTYYNELFKNAFIPTTIDINSLYLHSAIYNYSPGKATPSIAIGAINFDFSLLPDPGNDIIKRQVILKNLSFENNKIHFFSDTQYSFIEEKINGQTIYYAILTDSSGNTEYISSPSSYISVPFRNTKQYTIEELIITIPNYEYGTYYSIIIKSDDQYLFDLKANIRLSDKQYLTNTDYDDFNIKYLSYLSEPGELSCFLKPVDPKTWELKLGSGIHGQYVPKSIIKLTKYLTQGKVGNILVANKVGLNKTSIIETYYTSITNGEEQKSLNLFSIFDLQFTYSYGGSDSVSGQELKKKLIEYIQTRDTLVTKNDFYNLPYESGSEFIYSFRKSLLQQNIFFFYKLILNSYEHPTKCLCYNIPRINTANKVLNITSSQDNDSSGSLTSSITYKYTIIATDGFNYSTISDIIEVSLLSGNTRIALSWDSFINATYYIISVTTDDINYKYYTTSNVTCYDIGTNFQSTILDFSGNGYVYFPEYEIKGETLISPFIYKYNDSMKWYDGYIFYESFIVNFAKMTSTSTSLTLPVCYFEVQYDRSNKKTIFIVRSYQDLTDYELYLTLSDTIFVDQQMTMIDTNTFSIDYVPGDPNIIEGEHKLIVTLNNTVENFIITFTTSNFYQLKKIQDQLYLPTFTNEDDNYILNIPLIDKTDYIQDRSFYDDLFLKTFDGNLISENRFLCDNIQVRFLNTYTLPSSIFKYNTIQKYDFDLVLPLKISISILLNKQYITSNHIDLEEEKDNIQLAVAQDLQDNYTGYEIKYYNSKLIEFIHYSREYIKQVTIEVKDSADNLISNGLELISEQDTINLIQDDSSVAIKDRKMGILNYFPIYINWDLDNIDIDYRFDL